MTLFIENKAVLGEGEEFLSLNPYNSEIIWHANAASPYQVDLAVKGARKAFLYWKNTPFLARFALLTGFSEKLKIASEHLAHVIAEETGKPLWEARTEVAAMEGKVAISLRSFHDRTGENIKSAPEAKIVLRHRPLGVMAVFGPYNFPAHLPNGHIVPALLAGNTVVFKPSELTPKTAEETMKIWLDAGLPEGVINLVQGGRETGSVLASHKNIDGILFTGSALTGHLLHQKLAGHPEKMLALEMGGNNPMVVSDHYEDLLATLYCIIQSAFLSGGQRCTCARRLYIQKGQKGDALLSRLVEKTAHIKVGGPFDDPSAFFGAQISIQAAEKVLAIQDRLISLGGKPLLSVSLLHDALLSPGIIDVTGLEKLPDEEIFGPLLQVVRFDNLNQAVEWANETRYGLSAGLISKDDGEWDYFLNHIRAGIVNRNSPLTGARGDLPFGGVGASGNLRPSAYYAADYCAYPVASIEQERVLLPSQLSPGIIL